jgi:predicted MFS family arabinose efflux permease
MLMARAAVGLGEAAYGPAGSALLSGLFPMGRLAAVLGTFQAAAVFGTALGVVAGSAIGARHGWEAAFVWIGGGSLLLVILFPLLVREPAHAAPAAAPEPAIPVRTVLRALFAPRSARYIYLASGLQMLVLATIGAWIPTFIAREYGLATDAAGARAGLVIITVGIGMIVGGLVADRAAHSDGQRKLRVAAAYTLASFALLSAAFAMGPGPMQMTALVLGTLVSGAHAGVVAATVVDVTDPRLRATAVATVALFNNLLGLAPGPYLVGVLSDATGLKPALSIVTFSGLAAAILFLLAARNYERETVARRSHPGGVNAADGAV